MIYVVFEGLYEDRSPVGYSESFEEARAFARERSRAAHVANAYTVPFDEQYETFWEFRVETVKRLARGAEQAAP